MGRDFGNSCENRAGEAAPEDMFIWFTRLNSSDPLILGVLSAERFFILRSHIAVPEMSNTEGDSPYDGTSFSGFTFSQAPNPASFLDPTMAQDSTPQSSQYQSVSNFRRSTQRGHTPSRPFAAFPLTPHTPGSQYSRESSHIKDAFLLNSVDFLSQLSQPEGVKKGDGASVSQQYDGQMKAPLPDPPVSSGPTESTNSNATSVIQERLARMKQRRNTFHPQAYSSTRPFAAISGSSNPAQDSFLPLATTSHFKHVPLNFSEIASHMSSHSMSPTSLADSTVSKRGVLDHQQDLAEEPVSPMSRSKSVIGQRSSSVENPPSRELPAVLAEALLSAETWNEENEAMVR